VRCDCWTATRTGVGLLRAAVAAGVDHIDTAQYYGPATVNRLIRKALYPYPEGLAIVTKVGARRDSVGRFQLFNKPRELRQGIGENLKTLGVDQLPSVNLRLGTEPLSMASSMRRSRQWRGHGMTVCSAVSG
jgi:aryl-alcohol dehydrogenase-like predicted oxidoreductase